MVIAKKKVIITGGAGLIGGILLDQLRERYTFASFDRTAVPDIPSHVGDFTDFSAGLHAFQGQDTVVHLAADRRANSAWESTLPNNIIDTYNVFEAAHQAGVQRVVFTSSQHATGGYLSGRAV
jgi:nucleoside-diphosphate-sugar epimerase